MAIGILHEIFGLKMAFFFYSSYSAFFGALIIIHSSVLVVNKILRTLESSQAVQRYRQFTFRLNF